MKNGHTDTASRAIGGKAFAAISAVEGLHLSPAGRARLDAQKARGLSTDERRAEIVRAYRSDSRRA